MEKNYIRQLLLVLEDYLFSLKWYDKEGNEIMLKNIIGFDSIFQIIPKRFHKLLEGRIYTQEELSKAREEVEMEVLEWVISEEDVPQDIGYLWARLRRYEIYKEAHKRLSKLKDNK